MIGAVVSLVALTGTLMAVPLAPAFIELYLGQDTEPMPVKDLTENVSDFARDFRNLLEDGSPAAHQAPARASALVLETDVFLDEGLFFADRIYAKGKLAAGGHNVFSGVLGEKDIDLGENATVLSWAHAQGAVVVRSGSTVYGRLSAGEQVELGVGCSFERVHAPLVTVAGGTKRVPANPAQPEETSVLERVTNRILSRDDFVLEPGERLCSNVVAGRKIRLAEGSHVIGSLKSNGRMELGPNVRVEGSLVSASDLRIGDGCLVLGPVLAEGDLFIASGTQIGTPQRPTTVRAPRIRISPGVTIHGSLWAHERGQVKD